MSSKCSEKLQFTTHLLSKNRKYFYFFHFFYQKLLTIYVVLNYNYNIKINGGNEMYFSVPKNKRDYAIRRKQRAVFHKAMESEQAVYEYQAKQAEIRKEAERKAKIRETKRKVVSIANRLALKMNRSEAFIQAWAIVKAGGLELAVKGVSFGNRQEALKRLADYKPEQIKAVIVPEPENQFDHDAMAVMVGVNGGRGLYRLGYVPKNMTAVVNAMGVKLPALRIVSGTSGLSGWASKTTFGARLALAV